MSAINPTIKSGATISVTGGTDLVYSNSGFVKPNQVELYVPADTNLKTRRSAKLALSPPAINKGAPGGYTQNRATVKLRFPRTLTDGAITVDVIEITKSVDASATSAENLEYRKIAAQILMDSDFDTFWDSASFG